MFETAQEEKALNEMRKRVGSDEQQDGFKDKFKALQKKKVTNLLNLLKNLGDMITASQALGIPKKLFGFDFNDGHVGFGGLVSALITSY